MERGNQSHSAAGVPISAAIFGSGHHARRCRHPCLRLAGRPGRGAGAGLATYGIDDPLVEGVACHFPVPERGGVAGMFGVAEEVSDISLACRQIGPIAFKEKFEQGDVVFRESRSIFFKKMQIVRGCDVKRNVLVYMVYSDYLIEGSPKNSTSSVPVMPWGEETTPAQCAEWVEE
jgi:CreA protein